MEKIVQQCNTINATCAEYVKNYALLYADI